MVTFLSKIPIASATSIASRMPLSIQKRISLGRRIIVLIDGPKSFPEVHRHGRPAQLVTISRPQKVCATVLRKKLELLNRMARYVCDFRRAKLTSPRSGKMN
jgi:hypothetical protein